MRLHPASRRRLCAWLAGALLLVQWLVAAHACPLPPTEGPGARVAVHASASCHDEAPGGEEALCMAHCSDAQQLPAQAPGGDLAAYLPGWCIVLALPTLQVVPAAHASWSTVRAGAPPGWPPLYLLHGVLRN